MEANRFPPIPRDLLEFLEQRFPDRMPDSFNSDDLLRRYGNVQVIRLLRVHFDQQNKTVLDKSHV